MKKIEFESNEVNYLIRFLEYVKKKKREDYHNNLISEEGLQYEINTINLLLIKIDKKFCDPNYLLKLKRERGKDNESI